jgi:hypothetical protein
MYSYRSTGRKFVHADDGMTNIKAAENLHGCAFTAYHGACTDLTYGQQANHEMHTLHSSFCFCSGIGSGGM